MNVFEFILTKKTWYSFMTELGWSWLVVAAIYLPLRAWQLRRPSDTPPHAGRRGFEVVPKNAPPATHDAPDNKGA